MLRHVLLVKFREGVRPEEITSLTQAFRQLLQEIPAVAEGHVGPALGLPGSSGVAADYAVSLDFRSSSDFTAYIEDPRHRRFVAERLSPIREAAWSAQVEL